MSAENRDGWLLLDDDGLLRQCSVVTCRGTGPGGQKRNKTSSAVRLLHVPSGISAENDESRSQHINKLFAIRSLRLKIALSVRCAAGPVGIAPGANSDKFPLWVARVLDVLQSVEYRLSEAAPAIGLSTGKLVKELAKNNSVWQMVNTERTNRGMGTLRS